jgi:hypothetical protein
MRKSRYWRTNVWIFLDFETNYIMVSDREIGVLAFWVSSSCLFTEGSFRRSILSLN